MKKDTAVIFKTEILAEGIHSMTLRTDIAETAKAGQFVSVCLNDRTRLLPRPISICSADAAEKTIRLVYRVQGSGTMQMSMWQTGDKVQLIGPLGKGFPTWEAGGKRVLLVGGGIGIPPLVFAAEQLLKEADGQKPCELVFAAGYRSDDTYLLPEIEACARAVISTDDGSLGTAGTVLDAIRANGIDADLIFACGPKVMLRALKAYAEETGAVLYVSMEERMACGVGACLGCVTKTTATDSHSMVKNARVCTDGPVFSAEEVDLS